MTKSALQSHVTLICFIFAVHCFQFQNRTQSSFSELCVSMDNYRPRHEKVFHLFLTSHLSCCVNSKSIIGIHNFLSKSIVLKNVNIYKPRFSNALVKGDQSKVLDVQSQIFIINFFPGKFLSVDSFQKINFCIS